MYLLDTPIVLELRGAKTSGADAKLSAWAGGVPRQSLFLSALSLLELETGATRLAAGRDKAGAAALRDWIEGPVARAFEGRVLALDAAVMRRAARLGYADMRDALLAATALEQGLTLVTRKAAAFKTGKVKLFNPSGYTPEPDSLDDWRQATKGPSPWLRGLFNRS